MSSSVSAFKFMLVLSVSWDSVKVLHHRTKFVDGRCHRRYVRLRNRLTVTNATSIRCSVSGHRYVANTRLRGHRGRLQVRWWLYTAIVAPALHRSSLWIVRRLHHRRRSAFRRRRLRRYCWLRICRLVLVAFSITWSVFTLRLF